eukprot:CAMPEP_0114594398 /NCGR_PEP_ID=MMETSP0125-20121206/16049_1 /TAXON_ID=485358 ORGANISM="Aristerostoma sp., Strain ATCC 50986" /NCGR_SAMPLE_ID=MMETSP0125 /ASSEMBLY_ACC=CAM_ASM_000245 /LENGTH=158 /DNA_ID=CAMNT_0001794651 /DNA_START=275 /DNA_END=751 /DNA_ORIENTATION=+
MTGFGNTSKDFCDFFLMRVHISDHEGVEVHENEVMSADHSAEDTHNGESDVKFEVLLLEMGEELFTEILRIVDHIDREEVLHEVHLGLSLLSSLQFLHFSILSSLLGLSLLTEVLLLSGVFSILEIIIRIILVVLGGSGLGKEVAGVEDDLGMVIEAT